METILCLPQSNRLVRVMTHLELPDIDIEQLLFNRHVLNEYLNVRRRHDATGGATVAKYSSIFRTGCEIKLPPN